MPKVLKAGSYFVPTAKNGTQYLAHVSEIQGKWVNYTYWSYIDGFVNRSINMAKLSDCVSVKHNQEYKKLRTMEHRIILASNLLDPNIDLDIKTVVDAHNIIVKTHHFHTQTGKHFSNKTLTLVESPHSQRSFVEGLDGNDIVMVDGEPCRYIKKLSNNKLAIVRPIGVGVNFTNPYDHNVGEDEISPLTGEAKTKLLAKLRGIESAKYVYTENGTLTTILSTANGQYTLSQSVSHYYPHGKLLTAFQLTASNTCIETDSWFVNLKVGDYVGTSDDHRKVYRIVSKNDQTMIAETFTDAGHGYRRYTIDICAVSGGVVSYLDPRAVQNRPDPALEKDLLRNYIRYLIDELGYSETFEDLDKIIAVMHSLPEREV